MLFSATTAINLIRALGFADLLDCYTIYDDGFFIVVAKTSSKENHFMVRLTIAGVIEIVPLQRMEG